VDYIQSEDRMIEGITNTETTSNGIVTQHQVKQQIVRATIIRNGKRINLGIVAYYHKNALLRWIMKYYITLKLYLYSRGTHGNSYH